MSSREHSSRLYDIGAYLNAALAVAREVVNSTPGPNMPLLPEQYNHLGYLSEAVVFLLKQAEEMTTALQEAMDRSA
ncbi:hypothetical protein [Methylococcus capsulatus]|uniref:hypothetical protein n=1 Tax=Methylococcus capsulatus TaxID=414 RepID=UPI002FDAB1E1